VSLQEIYEQYHGQVQFIMIYIREAHPVDGWWFGGGIQGKLVAKMYPKASTDLYDPKTIEERRVAAGQCEEALKYGVRTYVDSMDDNVSKSYAAHPTRLYMVDLDGRVSYAGGLGPFGFKPAEFKAAIDAYLTTLEQSAGELLSQPSD
jgi:hypothetical protein